MHFATFPIKENTLFSHVKTDSRHIFELGWFLKRTYPLEYPHPRGGGLAGGDNLTCCRVHFWAAQAACVLKSQHIGAPAAVNGECKAACLRSAVASMGPAG